MTPPQSCNLDLRKLPGTSAKVALILENRITVKGINDEQRPLVANGHIFPVTLHGHQHVEVNGVAQRNSCFVIVQGSGDQGVALGTERFHQVAHADPFERHRAIVPRCSGGELSDVEFLKHCAVKSGGGTTIEDADLAGNGQNNTIPRLAQGSVGARYVRYGEWEQSKHSATAC